MLKDVGLELTHVAAENIEVVHVYGYRETPDARRRSDDKARVWACDVWRATLTYEGRSWSTEYRTGIGHRAASDTKGFYGGPETAKRKITARNILECLFSDAQSGYDLFESWCEDMGLDSDSRKALDTYLQCQRTSRELRRLFGADYSTIESEVSDDET